MTRTICLFMAIVAASVEPVRPAETAKLPRPERPPDFFVSPHGNDAWSGTLADPVANEGPFATIARARDAVRAMRKTRNPSLATRVVLRGGTYYLDTTLELGPEDSGTKEAPVVY